MSSSSRSIRDGRRATTISVERASDGGGRAPVLPTLAGGETLPAWEFGGGIEIDATSKAFFRADLSDRLLKYPGVTLDSSFRRRDAAFFGGAVRVTVGAGWRF